MAQTQKNSVSYSLGKIVLKPGEEVIGFEIEVTGGGFESISTLPRGWRIAVDNKSASHTIMNADLAFGSEFMSAADLNGIVVTLSQSEPPDQPFRVMGHLLVASGGAERRVSLSTQNFLPRSPQTAA